MVESAKHLKLVFHSRARGVVVILAVSMALTACSVVPEWAKPSVPEWVKPSVALNSVTKVFFSDSESKPAAEGKEDVSLSEVPKRPKVRSVSERRRVAEGLKSDRQNARYSDEEVREKEKVQVSSVLPKPTAKKQKSDSKQNIVSSSSRETEMGTRRVKSSSSLRRSRTDSLESRRIITSGTVRKSKALVSDRPARVKSVAKSPALKEVFPSKPTRRVVVASDRSLSRKAADPESLRAPKVEVAKAHDRPVVDTASSKRSSGSVFSNTYKTMLQQSAATVSTAPANASFKPASATPLVEGATSVAPIVRDTYNAALRVAEPKAQVNQVNQVNKASEIRAAVSFVARGSGGTAAPDVTIKFGHDSRSLSGADRAKLRKVVQKYRELGGGVRVVGHASGRTRNMDVVQHHLVNFRISVDRAQVVARELINLGVPVEMIKIEAQGASRPLFVETMPAGEAENRRTEIFLGWTAG